MSMDARRAAAGCSKFNLSGTLRKRSTVIDGQNLKDGSGIAGQFPQSTVLSEIGSNERLCGITCSVPLTAAFRGCTRFETHGAATAKSWKRRLLAISTPV